MAADDAVERIRNLLRQRAAESVAFGQADLDALMAAVAERQRSAIAGWAEAYYRQDPDEPSDAALAALDAGDPRLDPGPHALRSRIALCELVWIVEELAKALDEAFADFVGTLVTERLPGERTLRRPESGSEGAAAARGLATRMRGDRQRFLGRR